MWFYGVVAQAAGALSAHSSSGERDGVDHSLDLYDQRARFTLENEFLDDFECKAA